MKDVTELAQVQQFVDVSRTLSEAQELQRLLQDIIRELGFDYFALLHRVDLSWRGSDLDERKRGELIALSDYPDAWLQTYINRNLAADDPVLIASKQAHIGFCWSEIPEMIELTPHHLQQMREARAAGLGDGFTVPSNRPGLTNGSCHFVVRPERELPRSALLLAELVGIHAFHAARQIVERMHAKHVERAKLSPRQLDCIELVGRGKTDWEIAKILSISPATVKDYLDDARKKYGVTKRVQVVLRAVFEGQLSLADLAL